MRPSRSLPLRASFALRYALCRSSTRATFAKRFFTVSPSSKANRVFDDPVRTASELSTLILASSSSRRPLIALWTTSWCPSCKTIAPFLRDWFSSPSSSSSPNDGSINSMDVSYAEVEFDSPTFLSAGMADATGGAESVVARYAITSVPTLMAFDTKGDPQISTRLTDAKKMSDVEELRRWIGQVQRR